MTTIQVQYKSFCGDMMIELKRGATLLDLKKYLRLRARYTHRLTHIHRFYRLTENETLDEIADHDVLSDNDIIEREKPLIQTYCTTCGIPMLCQEIFSGEMTCKNCSSEMNCWSNVSTVDDVSWLDSSGDDNSDDNSDDDRANDDYTTANGQSDSTVEEDEYISDRQLLVDLQRRLLSQKNEYQSALVVLKNKLAQISTLLHK